MKALIVYDSLYGNTQKIANAISKGIKPKAKVVSISESKSTNWETIDMLIIGSPTHGGLPTSAISEFIENIPKDGLKNVKVAAFDTRMDLKDQPSWLQFLMKRIGFASAKILQALEKKGGIPIGEPEGFIVEDKEGPLRKGELKRAEQWAKNQLT